MPKFYDSIPSDLADWALHQSVVFVASVPLPGRHINIFPRNLPDASFAILNRMKSPAWTRPGPET